MIHSFRWRLAGAFTVLAMLHWTGEVQAAPTPDGPPSTEAAASAPRPDRAGLLGARPVAASVLDASRGGTQLSELKLNGVVADNQAINLSTGGNTIGEGAFANAAGLPMVVQNSGNNVLIQNATIVNVQVR